MAGALALTKNTKNTKNSLALPQKNSTQEFLDADL